MWQNWSGCIQASSRQVLAPKSEADLQQHISSAIKNNRSTRVVGSGHSFVPLCKTDNVLLNLGSSLEK